MADFPLKDVFFPAGAGSVGPTRTAQRWFYDAVRQLPGARARAALVLAADAAAPTQGTHTIDTEAAAATDDLKWLQQTALPDGAVLYIRSADNARDIVVKNAAGGAGQILLAAGGDFTLSDTTMGLLLERVGTSWVEVDRSYGGNKAGAFDAIKQAASEAATGVVEKSTSAENLAGVAADKFPDVVGVKEMIAALGNSTALETTMRMLSLRIAYHDATAVYLYDGWADSFGDQSGVDPAQAIAAIYVPGGGGYYHNPGSSSASTIVPTMTSNTAPSGTASASTNNTNAFQAFDGDLVISWESAAVTTGWVAYEFTATKAVNKYSILAVQDASTDRAPKDWTLEGWNGSAYVVLDTRTAQTGWAANETRTFTFVNSTAYIKYRLNVSANNGGPVLRVVELKLFEYIAPANMTVVSKAVVAAASAPTTGKLLIQIKDVSGTAVPNTDVKGWETRASTAVTADAATDKIAWAANGRVNGERVMFSNSGGGLPGGLTAGVLYHVVGAAVNDFQVSLTAGGAAVDITSVGTGTHSAMIFVAGTLALVQTLADGTKEYEFTNLDLSGVPSGTSVRAALTTHNAKEIQLHGWVPQYK